MYKLETVHKQALRVVLTEYTSSYLVILDTVSKPTLYVSSLKYIAIEVYKCYLKENPDYMSCHVGSIKQTSWFKKRLLRCEAESEHYVLSPEYIYLSGCKIVIYITIAHQGSLFHIRVQITVIKMAWAGMPLWLLWVMQHLQCLNGVTLTIPYFAKFFPPLVMPHASDACTVILFYVICIDYMGFTLTVICPFLWCDILIISNCHVWFLRDWTSLYSMCAILSVFHLLYHIIRHHHPVA